MDRPREDLINLKLISKNCIHTKHIYSLLDMQEKDESYKTRIKHLENCTICNDEFQRFQLKNQAALVLIPKFSMDKDLRQSFEGEVVELFKVMNLNNRKLLKRNVKAGFVFVDKMGIEFISNLISKTMLKTYIFAGVLFICLKLFL